MDIEEYKEKKRTLENDIRDKVSEMIYSFQNDTGYSPNAIHIDMLSWAIMGPDKPKYHVEKVRVIIDI